MKGKNKQRREAKKQGHTPRKSIVIQMECRRAMGRSTAGPRKIYGFPEKWYEVWEKYAR